MDFEKEILKGKLTMSKKRLVGTCGVDSGMIFIGDPCYFKHCEAFCDPDKWSENKLLHPIDSFVYDCDPWPSDHRAVVTEFAICLNTNIGDINLDGIINILDIITLVNEVLNSSNSYCNYIYADFDYNQELNILDIIQLISLILNN